MKKSFVIVAFGPGLSSEKFAPLSPARVEIVETPTPAAINSAVAGDEAFVVLVDARAHLTADALAGVLASFDDSGVVAAGPRLTAGEKPQLVDSGNELDVACFSAPDTASESWRGPSSVTSVSSLDGSCLVIRREAWDAIGGFDEGYERWGGIDLDLSIRLAAHGSLVVVPDQLVIVDLRSYDDAAEHVVDVLHNRIRLRRLHSPKPGDRRVVPRPNGVKPLLSVAMIVKDEEKNLPETLASVLGFADEIVVYDTGSTDRTKEIAAAAGAKVIDGYWDGDFARARNAGLEHCRGEWIMFVDADDVIMSDVALLRWHLQTTDKRIDSWFIPCRNLMGFNVAPVLEGQTWDSPRLFKRRRGHFKDRIHEQVVPLPGQRELTGDRVGVVTVLHHGYLNETVVDKNKAERNETIAEQEKTAGRGMATSGTGAFGLARIAYAKGDLDEAIRLFTFAVESNEGEKLLRMSLREGIDALVHQGNTELAREWLGRLREAGGTDDVVRFMDGIICLGAGELERGVELLETVEVIEQDGLNSSQGAICEARAKAKLRLNRVDDAVVDLINGLRIDPSRLGLWQAALPLWKEHDLAWSRLADIVPQEFALNVLHEARQVNPALAGELLEAIFERHGDDNRFFAMALALAPYSEVGHVGSWAARMQKAGIDEHSPLLNLASTTDRAPRDRLHAVLLLLAAFEDRRGVDFVGEIAGRFPPAKFEEAIVDIDAMSPELVGAFVEGAATTKTRCEALATILDKLGVGDVAEALREHGRAIAFS